MSIRVFNRNLIRWPNLRSRQRLNFWGYVPPENFRMHFLNSGTRISIYEQNRKHKSPLKLHRIQARFFVYNELILASPRLVFCGECFSC